MYRRLEACKVNNNSGNSRAENEPNMYEMSVDDEHRYTTLNIRPQASAPATYENVCLDSGDAHPSVSVRSSNDVTLIDNDLYQ